jgi:LuxR family transcriptional regulator, maltose regulon positive regulatory protein
MHTPDKRYITTLTPREVCVLDLVAEGDSNNEIARKLCVSVDTVKFHLKSIYVKLGVNRRVHAIHLAGTLGLIEPVGMSTSPDPSTHVFVS